MAEEQQAMDVDSVEDKTEAVMREFADEPMEEVKEKEVDAVEDSRPKYTDKMELSGIDATINCLVSEKNVVDSIPIDGTSLVACTRANFGVTGGRYYYEVEVLGVKGQNCEVLVGFSQAGSSLLLSDKETLCFSNYGAYYCDGEKLNSFRGRRFSKDDIVGVLINRTDEGNANTVSLFVNGTRAGKPQEIPDTFDGALFPHVSVKLAMISVNFSEHCLKALPFTVRMMSEACEEHISPSHIKEVNESKFVIPMGFDTSEYVQNYTDAHSADHFVQLTNQTLSKWQERSGVGKRNMNLTLESDAYRCIERMMALKKRNYVYAIGHNLLAKDREILAQRFGPAVKKTLVVDPSVIAKLPFNTIFAKDVTLPVATEGFVVEHTEGEGKSKIALENWQKRCKQQSLVTDLKPGEFFKTQWTKFAKFKESTMEHVEKLKKEKEDAEKRAAAAEAGEEVPPPADDEDKKDGEEASRPSTVDCTKFSGEDWMLLELRAELHLLVHAFKEDVEDKDRFTFAAEHLSHYYKLYHENKKQFSLSMWGVKSVSECVEIIQDSCTVEDGMLCSKLDKNTPFDIIVQQTEDARQNRVDRIGAGDEGASLKFKAPMRRAPAVVGAKGAKGGKQPYGKPTPLPAWQGGKGAAGSKPGTAAPAYQMRPVAQAQTGGAYKRPQPWGYGGDQPAKRPLGSF